MLLMHYIILVENKEKKMDCKYIYLLSDHEAFE